ncbi:MAG: hypothetical protein V8S28_06780 [Lachnospiraceae bacterium]
MMMSYDPDHKEYARLAGFGYRRLAEAISDKQKHLNVDNSYGNSII